MRNILINIALLLLSGCASTRVIKHDFATISSQLQDSYKIDFQKSKKWEGTELFIFDYRIELKEYKENEFLKLKTYSDFLGTMTTTLTLTPESESVPFGSVLGYKYFPGLDQLSRFR